MQVRFMRMIRVKKTLMGGYKEDEDYTHVILESNEYDELITRKDYAERELDKYKTAWRKTGNENTKLIEKYNILVRNYNEILKDNENIKKENKLKSEDVELYKEKCTELENKNNTLIRIHREKSNSKRELVPKKDHNGYLFISGKKIKFDFFETFKKKDCFTYRFQTAYDIFLHYDLVIQCIEKDLKERVLQDLDINDVQFMIDVDAFRVNKEIEKKKDYIEPIWKNINKAFIFDFKLNQNGSRGFWEVEFKSRDEIIINSTVLGDFK